ncbi:MAG: cation:proton antiporter [Chloroflexi bacterium]|nr:cation:proton antiporter [Chloroflexota bacterium]MCI0575431.1 cation:proton antiporter [Chloroflexota bacterium]MCI0649887.1 cation:proton antiporter [Chloroflexota bacterium]MCI0725657.1 cation:proton antiporter [Chloroflexota bacterium]
MNSQDFVKFALQITLMLACAVFFGQLMRKARQPAVVGEMFGGILLGPTLFGALIPALYAWLFQSSASVGVVRDASIKLGMLFFLFIAGLEVNLSDLRRLGRRAILIGLIGTLVPIGIGVALVYLAPRDFWGAAVQEHYLSFALFIGMNLANSANPVIARILMDLGMLKGEIGTLIMTATIVDDLINWTLFAIILGDIAPTSQATPTSLPVSIILVVLFFFVVLGLGRQIAPRALHWARGHVSWPSGFIALTALVILVAGSAAEALGIHAFLGAFLIGVALGGDDQEHSEAHDVINHFVLSFFAPIYFVSMGMTTDFIVNFDGLLVLLIVVVACLSKVGAVLLGAKVAGMPLNREAWAIGFGLNARGATGIILAGVGLANGVIDERIFVAIVVMALITSLMAGPMMNKLLSHRMAVKLALDNPGVLTQPLNEPGESPS